MIDVAPGLALPDELVTKTAAILAQRRKGKTYTASVLAEEMHAAGLPWVVLDPTGAWWGLRAAANGVDAGLSVVILGGQHADVPLERTGGALVADLVVDYPGWYVLDLSLMESKEAERQFATAFADRLYRRKGEAGMDFPLHLFVDEADIFVPQSADQGDKRMLGAFEAIVRRGGLRGLGTTLISQRPAVVNKNVLEQLDILIVLRMAGPNDQAAIARIVKANGTEEELAALMASLASLKLGEAWFWEPGAEPPLFTRAQVRERRTFNSSATPKPGETRLQPARMADVDLAVVVKAMAATVERAEASDPTALKRRVAQLERELAEARAAAPPVIDSGILAAAVASTVRTLLASLPELLTEPLASLEAEVRAVADAIASEATAAVPAAPPAPAAVVPHRAVARASRVPSSPERGAATPGEVLSPPTGAAKPLPPKQLDLLVALVPYPDGRTQAQIAVESGVVKKRSTFRNGLSALRTAGLIEGFDVIRLTPAGRALVADVPARPAPGIALAVWWLNESGLLSKSQQDLFRELVANWPEPMSYDELSKSSGVPRDVSTFRNGLSKLRTLGLVVGMEPVRAAPEVMG